MNNFYHEVRYVLQSSCSGHNQGAAAEADASGEQELKRTQSGSAEVDAIAEEDTIGELQLKWMQLGSSS